MRGATLRDVAREAEVSIASASRAINGLDNVAEGVRQRVLEAASRLRYVPHGGARSLATNRTNTVGVLLPDIYGEFFSELIRGIDVAARQRGLHILVSGSHGDLSEAVAAVRAMAGRVDGLLVMSPFVDAQDLAAVLPLNLPLVTISSRLGEAGQGAISIDNYGGGLKAVRHLREVGCKRIAHISGPSNNFEAAERRRGYVAGLSEGVPLSSPLVYEGDFTEATGYEAARFFMVQSVQPDAIFAANDMMAVGCVMALREAGLKVPQDVAVVGFDDIPIVRFTSPPLSTLRVGIYDIGQRGMEILATTLDSESGQMGSGITVLPELVVRESSRRNQG